MVEKQLLNFPLDSIQGISLAKEYQNNSSLQWTWALESLKKLTFKKNDNVLDVGCGDGKITAFIASQVPQGTAVGLDISKEMVLHASMQYSSTNLQFIQGDATCLSYSQQFDKLVCFSTLHWIQDQKKALTCFKSCLKPCGTLFLVVPDKSPSNLGIVAEKITQSEKWASFFPHFKPKRIYYSSQEYITLLKAANFQVQSIETSKTITKHPNKESLIANVYRNTFKIWFWTTRKLSRSNHRKSPNIRNMRRFTMVGSRGFGAVENPNFECVSV